MANVSKKPLTKTELLANIAAEADVSKKQVAAVLEALANQIKSSLSKKGSGVIAIPELVKIEEEACPGPQGPEERTRSVPSWPVPRRGSQARLQQGKGADVEAAQGHGEVAIRLGCLLIRLRSE